MFRVEVLSFPCPESSEHAFLLDLVEFNKGKALINGADAPEGFAKDRPETEEDTILGTLRGRIKNHAGRHVMRFDYLPDSFPRIPDFTVPDAGAKAQDWDFDVEIIYPGPGVMSDHKQSIRLSNIPIPLSVLKKEAGHGGLEIGVQIRMNNEVVHRAGLHYWNVPPKADRIFFPANSAFEAGIDDVLVIYTDFDPSTESLPPAGHVAGIGYLHHGKLLRLTLPGKPKHLGNGRWEFPLPHATQPLFSEHHKLEPDEQPNAAYLGFVPGEVERRPGRFRRRCKWYFIPLPFDPEMWRSQRVEFPKKLAVSLKYLADNRYVAATADTVRLRKIDGLNYRFVSEFRQLPRLDLLTLSQMVSDHKQHVERYEANGERLGKKLASIDWAETRPRQLCEDQLVPKALEDKSQFGTDYPECDDDLIRRIMLLEAGFIGGLLAGPSQVVAAEHYKNWGTAEEEQIGASAEGLYNYLYDPQSHGEAFQIWRKAAGDGWVHHCYGPLVLDAGFDIIKSGFSPKGAWKPDDPVGKGKQIAAVLQATGASVALPFVEWLSAQGIKRAVDNAIQQASRARASSISTVKHAFKEVGLMKALRRLETEEALLPGSAKPLHNELVKWARNEGKRSAIFSATKGRPFLERLKILRSRFLNAPKEPKFELWKIIAKHENTNTVSPLASGVIKTALVGLCWFYFWTAAEDPNGDQGLFDPGGRGWEGLTLGAYTVEAGVELAAWKAPGLFARPGWNRLLRSARWTGVGGAALEMGSNLCVLLDSAPTLHQKGAGEITLTLVQSALYSAKFGAALRIIMLATGPAAYGPLILLTAATIAVDIILASFQDAEALKEITAPIEAFNQPGGEFVIWKAYEAGLSQNVQQSGAIFDRFKSDFFELISQAHKTTQQALADAFGERYADASPTVREVANTYFEKGTLFDVVRRKWISPEDDPFQKSGILNKL